MDNQDIKQRYDALRSQRQTLDAEWDTIERFIMPLHGGKFFQEQASEHEMDWRRREVFDSTAMLAAQTLAASLHGSMTSPISKWFELRFREAELNDDNESAQWLSDVGESIYQALQDSNFNLKINEVYLDLVGFGTSVIVEEEKTKNGEYDGLQFDAVPVREIYFEDDTEGNILRLYRRLQWTPLQIMDFFKDKVPDLVREKAASPSSLDTRMDVIYCIWEKKKADKPITKALAPARRPIGYKYILHQTAETLGKEGGYYEMPAFIPRYRLTSGSKYGYSPSFTALPHCLTLQEIIEQMLVHDGKIIDPPIFANQRDIIGDLDLGRGGMNVVRDINGVKEFLSNQDLQATQVTVNDLRREIREMFHVDQLELKDSPAMTATETSIRYELMQRLLGPTLGRLKTDLLDRIVARTFNILLRAGQLPAMPEAVAQSSAELDVEYLGPLPRAQRQDDAGRLERFAQGVGNLAAVNPRVLRVVKWDDLVKEHADLLGIPPKLLMSAAELAQMDKAEAAQRQMAEQMEQANQVAEVAEKGSRAVVNIKDAQNSDVEAA